MHCLHRFGHIVVADDLDAGLHHRDGQRHAAAQPLVRGGLGRQRADHALAAGANQQRAAQRMEQRMIWWERAGRVRIR